MSLENLPGTSNKGLKILDILSPEFERFFAKNGSKINQNDLKSL